MKLLHKVLGIASLGLIVALPLINQSPVRASFPQVNQIIAQASQKSELQLNLTAAKKSIVVTKDAQEQVNWESLDNGVVVSPGDILRYTISSDNPGAKVAKDLTVTQPIPDQMIYEIGTATSKNQAEVIYSIDNGKTFVAKPTITIKTEEGKTIKQPAPAEAYTHIRWKFGSVAPTVDIAATYEVKVK